MVSLKDIAAACEVSVATVSKALNNQKDIGEETKKRVRTIAKELGYHPNASARTLKTNRSYNLGVLYKEKSGSGLTHDYFSQVLEHFRYTAENSGYDITFLSNSKTRKDKMSYLEHSVYRRMDGVMIAVADYNDPEVIELLRSDFQLSRLIIVIAEGYLLCQTMLLVWRNCFHIFMGRDIGQLPIYMERIPW